MAIEPTIEQQAAREVFTAGRDLALVAGAGTGKTATLILMGAATRRRGLYVAFNKAIAAQAEARFGSNVECRTSHSLAYQAVGVRYRDRLAGSARVPSRQTAQMLGITRDLDVDSRQITVAHQARLVMNMVRWFCRTNDEQVMARHLENVNGLDEPGQEYLAQTLLPYARRAWDDICATDGRLRFEHDHYMKLWAMTRPQLPADFVLLDEAQDTNPVLEDVFLSQHAQRICVGDPAQQIYGWRGARDVMTGFPAELLHLTQSFRFGPTIAAEANRWLPHAESDMQLTGHGPAGSRLDTLIHPAAVLCRSNSDAIQEVLSYLELGIQVALTGGGSPLLHIAEAALQLKAGRRTSHRELFLFRSWGEVQDYVDHDKAGQDLKAIVDLVDTHGPDLIIDSVNRLSSEDSAQVTVSTAHKAKGREWESVRIGDGFQPPGADPLGGQRLLSPAEARLIYVATTRARHTLDNHGVAWLEDYEQARTTTTTTGLPVGGVALIDLNLTAQLGHDQSPVSEFMATHLPEIDQLVRDYLHQLDTLPSPVQPTRARRPDWSNLGHTIDYRLRLSLGGDLGAAVDYGIAAFDVGLQLPGRPDEATSKALHAAGEELLARIDEWRADPSLLDTDALTRLCYVAGYFEDIYRSGHLRPTSLLGQASAATRLDDLTAAVPAHVVDDIDQQMRLAADGGFADFWPLPAEQRICGPEFTGSSDIGGADADYILGGLLLDCKATKAPRRLGRDELYQLAGYLLLDYDDQYGIDRVGLYLSRQGGLITWPAETFLHQLGSKHRLPQLRSLFRDHLRAAQPE